MGARSKKRQLKGLTLRRFNLSVHPTVAKKFEKIAGSMSYNVAFEQIVEYVALKKERQAEKTRSPNNSLDVQQTNT